MQNRYFYSSQYNYQQDQMPSPQLNYNNKYIHCILVYRRLLNIKIEVIINHICHRRCMVIIDLIWTINFCYCWYQPLNLDQDNLIFNDILNFINNHDDRGMSQITMRTITFFLMVILFFIHKLMDLYLINHFK